MKIDWKPLATELGYINDKVMLEREYSRLKSLRKMEKLLGVSKFAITRRMKHHGIKLNGLGGNNNPKGCGGTKWKKIVELHNKECTPDQIAERLGTSNTYVYRVISMMRG